MDLEKLIFGGAAMLFAFLIAFTMTPVARVIAYKIGAIDVPKDNRRMHKHPIPRLGGLAIFIGFTAATMAFADYTPAMLAIWFGGLIIVVLGIIDDVFRLNAWIKLAVQILVAFIAVWQGLTVEFINLFGHYIVFGVFEIPITILWVVGLTNAINFIDGLDGLACGVSAICAISLLLVTITTTGDGGSLVLIMAILTGACLGFLPFNSNPAKIIMGDTGALFLGYTLAVISIDGLYKFNTVMSFLIPLSIFGVPLFDTLFAIVRRLLKRQNPFTTGDRGHLHHRLIDMGFNQKQSVRILYAVCGILGIAALLIAHEMWLHAIGIILVGFIVYFINFMIVRNPKTVEQAGLGIPCPKDEKVEENETKTNTEECD